MSKQLFTEKIQRQVAELLSNMSLAQKIGQMTQADRMTCTPDDVYQYGLGSVLSSAGSCPEDNSPQGWLDMCEQYWAASMRLRPGLPRIPVLYGLDAVHGHGNVFGATVFPHNIGLGASRDTELAAKVAEATRREVLATGVDWVFGPNLAVARDKHWGRCYESISESPELVAKFASPLVKSLQNSLLHDSVIACAKHWIGDGGTGYGIDQGNTRLPLEELKRLHVTPFIEAINAGVLSIMVSFSSWNGTKCHASDFLLSNLLKKQLNFQGFVVSDMQGIDYVDDDFHSAVEVSVNAGIDMFMVPENWQTFIGHLTEHVEMGKVPMSRINDAVTRILSAKMAFGLFDKPSPKQRTWAGHSCFGSEHHRNIARQAAAKSLVLLKNESSTLPIKPSQKILVCGKNAHNLGHQCGGFTITWQGESGNDTIAGTTIWQAIQKQSKQAKHLNNAAIQNVKSEDFDVAVVVIGERPYAEGMGDIRSTDQELVEMSSAIQGHLNLLEPQGDSLELGELYPEDRALLQELKAKGIPTVAVLISGRPLVINHELPLCDALVAAWLPGSEGDGVADVIFGKQDFTGKLPCSWPVQSQANINVGDEPYKPLFPFGYGLRYNPESELIATNTEVATA